MRRRYAPFGWVQIPKFSGPHANSTIAGEACTHLISFQRFDPINETTFLVIGILRSL